MASEDGEEFARLATPNADAFIKRGRGDQPHIRTKIKHRFSKSFLDYVSVVNNDGERIFVLCFLAARVGY